MHRSAILALAAFFGVGAAAAQTTPTGNAIIAKLDQDIQPREMDGWLKLLAAEPNHVSSPHDKSNAEWILEQFKDWGWDAHIETFKVLYPTPVSEALEMKGWTATLQEPPIPGDTSSTAKDRALPAYLDYQGDGDVTAPLVYVNYGNVDDLQAAGAVRHLGQGQDRHRPLWRRLARAEGETGAGSWRGRRVDLFRSRR